MPIFSNTSYLRKLLAAIIVLVLAGCAAERMRQDGLSLIAVGRFEEGLTKLNEAAAEEPGNLQFRTLINSKRGDIVNRLLISANSEKVSGKYDEAEKLFQRALRLDPANVRARDGLEGIARERRHAGLLEQTRAALKKGDTDLALALLRQVEAENPNNIDMLSLKRSIDEYLARQSLAAPSLKSLFNKPVTLEFRDANLKMVFEVLSRTSGINFILDKDVKPDLRATIFLKQSSLEDAVDLLLAANQLEKKILNQNSILIYPNTAAKIKDYQDLVVKSFYLANADVKQTQAMIKTMLKTKDIFVDEKLNMLMMRDTPEAIRLAEKLIAMHDLSEPEVMLEVEILEVKRSRLLDLGIQYPNQLALTPLPSGTTLTLNDLGNINSSRIGASLPSAVINMRKEDGHINILANPRIRARNREKAKIMIGDKVPVITTTAGATGFVAENVQYVDVGLKLEVEPNVYLQNDVGIKVSMEVSSLVREVRSSTGTLTYQIGTRNASSVLRLKDGETQILAGLISDEDRSTASKVPGLGDMPVLGRLFSNHRDDNQKTEIVLSITPRLIRNIRRPDAINEEIWSGTESTLRLKPLTVQSMKIGDLPGEPIALRPATSLSGAAGQSANKAAQPEKALEPASTPPTAVTLSWQAPAQVKAGEQFKVALHLQSDGAVRSMPFQIGFDPKVLQIIEVTEAEFFKQGNAKTNFVSNIDAAGGKAFVGAARTTPDGAKGEDNIAFVTFKAMAASPRTEIKLLAATPIGINNTTPAAKLPAPHSIAVSN